MIGLSSISNANDLIESAEGFDKLDLEKIIESAIHWSLVNGFVIIPRDFKGTDLPVCTFLPFTLIPTPLKREYFQQILDLQPKINQLIYKIASSPLLLKNALGNLMLIDPFIKKLWTIYEESAKNGFNQKITVSLLRTDYMLHQKQKAEDNDKFSLEMKQVEINTMAVGGVHNGTKMCSLHQEILKWMKRTDILEKMPKNEPLLNVANALVLSWRLYGSPQAILIFVVLELETNIADQRHLEYEITKQEPGICIKRCTLAEMFRFSHLNEDKVLFFDGKEVGLVYYRAGYDPRHFKSQEEWDALLKIELSKSIKCPNIGTFLAGLKKIQEFLFEDENLDNILFDEQSSVNSIRSVFAEFYNLKNDENIQKALSEPEMFVLKPQREGGGNNYYKSDIRDILLDITDLKKDNASQATSQQNRQLYVLMELLKPVVNENFIISAQSISTAKKQGKNILEKIRITNEIGIFGALVQNGPVTVLNEASGYFLRSKPAENSEGGIIFGAGAFDSIYFSD